MTARVALADTLINYALKARASGYANTVTGERWQLFNKRLMMAEDVLNEAGKLKEKCPHWYVEMLRLGQMQGWEPARFNEVFDEAVAFEPTYYYYYRVKTMYLLPRWYGEPGEWERFADEASRKVGGEQGAMIYYFTTTHIRPYYGTHFFICLLAAQAGERDYAPCVRR